MAQATPQAETNTASCKHCGRWHAAAAERAICAEAYQRVHRHGLGRVYQQRPVDGWPLHPQHRHPKHWLFGDENWLATFAQPGTTNLFEFRAQALTDPSLAWLAQQWASRLPGIAQVKVNGAKGTLSCRADRNQPEALGLLVDDLAQLGIVLDPRPSQKASWQRELGRVAVAWFVFLNVMMLATVEYLDWHNQLPQSFALAFRWLQAGLTTIALVYPAWPLWRAVHRAWQQGRLNFDTTLALGITAGFGMSCWHLTKVPTSGHGAPVYFDSVAAIIALMMTARFLLARSEALHSDGFAQRPTDFGRWERRNRGEPVAIVQAIDIRQGDLLRLRSGDLLPVAAQVPANATTQTWDLSPEGGELQLASFAPGESIPAGLLASGEQRDVIATEAGLNRWSHDHDRELHLDQRPIQLDKVQSRWLWLYGAIVPGLAFVFGVLVGPEAALAALLVACPCALAYGLPLAQAFALQRARQNGFDVARAAALWQLGSSRHWIFDRAGTLTLASATVATVETHQPELLAQLRPALAQVLSSHHYAARAIGTWAQAQLDTFGPEQGGDLHWREENQGMTAQWRGKSLRLAASPGAQASQVAVALSWQGQPIATFGLELPLKADVPDALAQLRAQHNDLYLLTGSAAAVAKRQSEELQLKLLGADQTPRQKAAAIAALHDQSSDLSSVMVGDSFNDREAFAAANVSIALPSGYTGALHRADIVMTTSKLSQLATLQQTSQQWQRNQRAIVTLAISATVVALAAAGSGLLTPLGAAIVMPLVALTITRLASRYQHGATPRPSLSHTKVGRATT